MAIASLFNSQAGANSQGSKPDASLRAEGLASQGNERPEADGLTPPRTCPKADGARTWLDELRASGPCCWVVARRRQSGLPLDQTSLLRFT